MTRHFVYSPTLPLLRKGSIVRRTGLYTSLLLLDDNDGNISVYSNAPTIPDDHTSDSVEDIAGNELRPDELEFTEGERHPDFVNIDFEDDSDLDPDYDPISSQYDDEVESTDSEVVSERVRCVRIERGRGRGRPLCSLPKILITSMEIQNGMGKNTTSSK
ncbi:hypothetical protein J6590_038955 [Homalodisca vitripennis]|nr:hypothetical protein J6590_038955 [Homalodisca vitripennis]